MGKLRGVWKLYNLEEGTEITENELPELSNRKEVADKEEIEGIIKIQEEKGKREERTEE